MTEVVAPHQQGPHTTENNPRSPLSGTPKPEEQKQQTSNPQTGQTPEEDEKARQLAIKLAEIIERALEKIQPILNMITELMDKADTKSEDFDEQKFIDQVKPLIEQATNILNEAHGAIKAVDPTGEISKNAQRKSADHKASAEEQRLAEALTKLTGDVTKTIDNAKKKISTMSPKAKESLLPLLALLQDPLVQILSAVGLLLNGVLTLVGNLLDGLGLGNLVRKLLTGIGLDKLLKGLGLGKIMEPSKAAEGGGLLGGVAKGLGF